MTDPPKPASDYEEQMLENQDSPFLLRFQLQMIDGIQQCSYDVSGMTSLEDLTGRRQISLDLLHVILDGLQSVTDTLHEYLLDPDSLLMDPGCLFFNPEETSLRFACLPGYKGNFKDGIRDLARLILEHLDHRNQNCVLLAYSFYRTTQAADFSIAMLRQLIYVQESEKSEEGVVSAAQPEAFLQDGLPAETIPAPAAPAEVSRGPETPLSAEKKGKSFTLPLAFAGSLLLSLLLLKCGVTAVLLKLMGLSISPLQASGGFFLALSGLLFLLLNRFSRQSGSGAEPALPETEPAPPEPQSKVSSPFLSAAPAQPEPPAPFRFRDYSEISTDETILLRREEFCLVLSGNSADVRGKTLTASDFPAVLGSSDRDCQLVLDSPVISRRHAVFEKRGDSFLVSDAGSTNGTYLEGRKLRPEERAVLENENHISFADLEFEISLQAGPADQRSY